MAQGTLLPPQRSLLAVPATNPRFLEKAAQSAADAVFIDLEDAVVPGLKATARGKAIAAITGIDWGQRRLGVRVNDLTTEWGAADLVELARAGLRAACKRAAALGYEGKMAIHPSQVDIANEVFSPPAAQVAWAREVLDAMAAAAREGRCAVKTKAGEMIDLVHIKIARKVLERAERIATTRR